MQESSSGKKFTLISTEIKRLAAENQSETSKKSDVS